MKKQTSEVISSESLVNELKGVLNLGLDVHYRQVTVAMQEDGGRIKAVGKMGYVDFLNWVRKKLEEGWEINSCYEAAHALRTFGRWASEPCGAGCGAELAVTGYTGSW